jgi:uncharacterized UPF0146 family protein
MSLLSAPQTHTRKHAKVRSYLCDASLVYSIRETPHAVKSHSVIVRTVTVRSVTGGLVGDCTLIERARIFSRGPKIVIVGSFSVLREAYMAQDE